MSDLSALGTHRIGFVGCGAMATALAGGLRAAGFDADRLAGSDPLPEARRSFEAATGARANEDNEAVVQQSQIVVIAVKPAAVESALQCGAAGNSNPLWISIAAGVPIATLTQSLPSGSRVLRAMPNTPALIGAGATAFCANPFATDDDRAAAHALFGAVGSAWEAPNEPMLDAVTGLSGSGPAYVFVMIEALADAGVREGLPRAAALQLAAQTVYGAARLVIESGRHPASLKDQVASPGGTTIAGLEALERGGLRATLYRAVEAAARRSRELGRKP